MDFETTVREIAARHAARGKTVEIININTVYDYAAIKVSAVTLNIFREHGDIVISRNV